jgi:CheY-like chemotaxis protein
VCPLCGSCFCKAPAPYKQRYWTGAPRELWERKFAEQHGPFELPVNPPPDQVCRPLVLVVDDEDGILQAAGRVVAGLGYGLILARNGSDGLALARRYRPELVLTDALMPGLDGRELCRQLKSEADTRAMRVVVMTALYTAPRYQTEGIRHYQADQYVAKPLDVDQLDAILRGQLGART